MKWIARFVRNLVRRQQVERELDDELHAVRDLLVDEKRRAGKSEAAAETPLDGNSAPSS